MSRQSDFNRRKREEGSDIGTLPPVGDPERRESCRFDLLRYLVTYFPETTGKHPFGPEHIDAIKRIELSILKGGLFVNVFPRGYAKTTIGENAALWAVSYGHRRFVPIFGANEDAAMENIASIKKELQTNELLAEDFPEICLPIIALDGKPQRCSSQKHVPGNFEGHAVDPETPGRLTDIVWKAEKIVFPTIIMPDGKPSAASGACIETRGLESGARGMKFKTTTGQQQRPDFVIIDDPQTDQSAESPTQVKKRLNIIRKSIMRLGGHGRRLAVVVNATIIQPEDLITEMIDPEKFPAWQSKRISMMPSMADAHDTEWLGNYATIRNKYDRDSRGDQERAHKEATAYYALNRERMDAGAVVSWDQCYDRDTEISAIQHAYNILIDEGPEVFASECQNQPEADDQDELPQLVASDIAKRANNLPRGVVPNERDKITAFIDVQGEVLFWVLVAWTSDTFGGDVIDYGSWPEQKVRYFGLSSLRRTLSDMYPEAAADENARIYAGLAELVPMLTNRICLNEAGTRIPLARGMIDYGWGKSEKAVYQVCRGTNELWIPSKGRGIGAKKTPMSAWKPLPGAINGENWRISRESGIARMLLETNYWKSRVRDLWLAPVAAKTALSIYSGEPEYHRLFGEHQAAERCKFVTAEGRTILEFDNDARRENHWGDCVVGAAVAAATVGVKLPKLGGGAPTGKVKRRSLKAVFDKKRIERYGR